MKMTQADLDRIDPGASDWARIDAMTDEEAEANALADPDNPPLTDAVATPRVKIIRRALLLTREEFAARYQIPIETLRDWEERRCEPDAAARAFLKVIAKHPDLVAEALIDARAAAAAE